MTESTRDSNGTILNDGDQVTLIKDLKVKGTSETLKRHACQEYPAHRGHRRDRVQHQTGEGPRSEDRVSEKGLTGAEGAAPRASLLGE